MKQASRLRNNRLSRSFIVLCVAAASSMLAAQATAPNAVPPRTSRVPREKCEPVQSYPHDRQAFTQGLAFVDGALYEGTGQHGRSSLRRVELSTGAVLQQTSLPAEHFGEGITVKGTEIFQLTWQSGVAFVYDRKTFGFKRTLKFRGEGWGLTHNAEHLIISDGSPTLRFLNATTFAEIRQVTVTDAGLPIDELNELEWVRGEIYANVWHSDWIARISPTTGQVLGWIDCATLRPAETLAEPESVLNGIAFDESSGTLLLTGKLWPKIFEVRTKR